MLPAAPSASSAAASSAACSRSPRPSSASRCTSIAPDADSPAFDVAAAAHRRAPIRRGRPWSLSPRAVERRHLRVRKRPGRSGGDPGAARAASHPSPRALATTQDRLDGKDLRRRTSASRPRPSRRSTNEADLDAALRVDRPARHPEDPAIRLRRQGPGDDPAPASTPPPPSPTIGRAPASSKASCPSSARSRSSPRAAPSATSPPTISAPTRTATTSSTSPACPPASRRRPRKRRPSPSPGRIADALDYVGVLAVEMFLVRDAAGERLVVNEIAPRVHNSGHWTIEGALTSQFEQHVRAVCGWPLGATDRVGRGRDAQPHRRRMPETGRRSSRRRVRTCTSTARREARPGRKMGHVTRVFPDRGRFARPLSTLLWGICFVAPIPGQVGPVLITTPPTVEVRRTRLLSLLVQSKRLQHTRKTRAGSCPG